MFGIFKLHRSEKDWYRDEGKILFAWVILNPNGPTFSCIGIRYCGSPGQIEVFYRWMHFTGGESFVLGYVGEGPNLASDLIAILRHAFCQQAGSVFSRFSLVTCVPSFVVLNDEEDSALIPSTEVLGLFLLSDHFRLADWGREFYYLQKYGSEFFDRAAEETREAVERLSLEQLEKDQQEFLDHTKLKRANLSAFSDWKPDQYISRPMADQDPVQWWSTITAHQFQLQGLAQLGHAWVGAIFQTRQTLKAEESFEMLSQFTEHHKMPLWPEEWTTNFISRRMGFMHTEQENSSNGS